MLLTDTIANCNSAIEKRRMVLENKQMADNYIKALAQLSLVITDIKNSLDCAVAMKINRIIDTPLLDESARSELSEYVDTCGNGIDKMSLTLATVNQLKSKGEAIATQIKIIWKDAATKYAEGTKGYLSIIGGLTDNPLDANKLADSIEKTISDVPSASAVSKLIEDVATAKKITASFSINTNVVNFLTKVSSMQATVLDLTPDILSWLEEKKLSSKLKVRF